ncbi:MAG: pyridoxamine 5'-phosphate oxidase family protein [Bacteroidales bacterium]|jgi:uncharacterized protein|nr:pyridoxamine 5'-phosphate oxidase family protein [Bacteroidales bacterium]MDD2205169.1 pyridoxamine 5'-phosphate oxidase family protein [Bacteroidales bacterium]MDD3152292.1 pyridoxamine 5'-phosphate oxidase family protein [Bacteroidales bacterium]MDD3914705.1 pyridoxamine 5'-phosphate oxidase family protein [Bacteroidales bacterium]MDD4634565.1 pyridoxamine 5'-phosphate oxidase family protein [Bacteroidales bacterium]
MSHKIIDNKNDLVDIMLQARYCSLAMVDGDMPYVVPMNFAFNDEFVYLHGASTGRKIDILKHNPKVCLCFCCDGSIYHQDKKMACSYGMNYKSVIIYGHLSFVDNYDEKVSILNKVMEKYTGKNDFKYGAPSVRNVGVYKVKIEEISGRIKEQNGRFV